MDSVDSDRKRRVRRELTLFVSLCFIVGVIFCFVISSYLNKGLFEQFISFLGSDGPAGYANSIVPRRLGVHTFGDYLLPRWQSNLDSPWFITDLADGPRNNYLPFTMAVFWLFSTIAYWESFILFMAIGTGAMFAAIWLSLSEEDSIDRAQLILSSVVLTSPFISLMDRGNIQILLTALVCLSIVLFIKGRESWGAAALGLAIALKGYPILFLFIWIRARRWKDCIIALSVSGITTLIPLLFYDGGILRNLFRIFRNVRLNENLYAHESLAYNNSLKGSLLSLESFQTIGISSAAQFAYNNIQILNLLVLVFAVIVMLHKKDTLFDISLIAAAIATTLVDYVAAYALGLYFVALMTLGHGAHKYSAWKRRVLFLLIGIQLMPKGFPIEFWSETLTGSTPTYASLLGGLVGILILGFCGVDVLRRKSYDLNSTDVSSL